MIQLKDEVFKIIFVHLFFSSSLEKWKYVMIFLLANTLACVTFAVLVNINDKRKVTLKEVISLRLSPITWAGHGKHMSWSSTHNVRTNVLYFVSLKD